jgi:PTH2 family peptidyl-tRNA hydrolase
MQQQSVKQVIVMRKDLKMRRGKEIAQGSHASTAWLRKRIGQGRMRFSTAEEQWMDHSSAKIVCQVDNEEELLEIYTKARQANLEVHLITDSGKTEFGGVPTKTCLAIGPDYDGNIDPITGLLKLY